jgi:Domain of unknown function (DUF4386)
MSFAVSTNVPTGGLSLLAALFSVAGFAIGAVNIVLNLVSLAVLRGAAQLDILSIDQLHALAFMFSRLRTQAAGIGVVFFALDCLLIGFLIWKAHVTALQR